MSGTASFYLGATGPLVVVAAGMFSALALAFLACLGGLAFAAFSIGAGAGAVVVAVGRSINWGIA